MSLYPYVFVLTLILILILILITYLFEGKTELEKAQESLNRASKEEIATITEAFKHVPKDSLDAESQIKKIQEKIITSTTLSNDDKERVISLVRGTISTQYGIIAESGTATKIEIAESIEIKKDDSFYSYPICSIGNHVLILTLIIFMHHHHHNHHHSHHYNHCHHSHHSHHHCHCHYSSYHCHHH